MSEQAELTGAVGESIQQTEITPEMVEAGVRAYLQATSHDEMSFSTPEETVRAILLAAISLQSPA